MEYGEVFSKAYQKEWGDYPVKFAKCVKNYLNDEKTKNVLDLCCGTGHLSQV